MNNFKTSINEYVGSLKAELENINSVSRCRRYKGNFNGDSLKKIGVNLRQKNKCEVFIQILSSQAEIDKVNRGVILNNLIHIHMVGITDVSADDLGDSDNVNDCCLDIYQMLALKRNTLNGSVQFGDPILGSLTNTYDSTIEETRETISTISFTQKIKT